MFNFNKKVEDDPQKALDNSDTHVTTDKNVHELRVDGYPFIVNTELQNYKRRGDSYELLANARGSFAEKDSPLDNVEIIGLVEKGEMMEALQLYRTLQGASFEEARAIVEDIKLRLG